MRVRFQADADLDARIVRGVKRREPLVDFQTGEAAGFRAVSDPEVLQMAAGSGRILVTHDKRTMPGHFSTFVAHHTSPGVFIVQKDTPIGVVVEDLSMIWAASDAEEWQDRLVWIPLQE